MSPTWSSCPSGKPALVLSASAANARSEAYVDGSTLQYEPAQDYRGEASVTFEVTDGRNADDPEGRKALLTVPVTVGDPNFEDTPPVFTPRAETIEAGEQPLEIDLRSSSDHPNPDVIGRLGYSNLAGTTADVQAAIDGGVLRVSAPLGVQPGTATRLTFDVTFNEFTVPGYVDVKVVSSTRAKAQAVDDGPIYLKRSETATIDVLANDFNPFPEVPLKVIGAEVDQLDVGSSASASFTSTGVSVRTGAAFTGTLSVIYRIQDATKDPARETQGRVTVIVRDRPEQPNAPAVTAGDAFADVRWQAPAPNNSAITGLRGELQRAGRHLRRGRRRHHPAHHRTRQRHRVHLRRARDQRHRRLGVVGGHDRDALRHADGPAERAAHLLGRRPGRPHRELERPGLDGRRRGRLPVARHRAPRAGRPPRAPRVA